MGRVWLAFKVFFDVLFNAARAEQIRKVEAFPPDSEIDLNPETEPVASTPVSTPAASQSAAPIPSTRSDALTLLEALQREARLIDFLQEEIESYSDQQVGSAAREVHRGCRDVLQRMFSIVPVMSTPEGSAVTVSGDEDAARLRLIGQVVEARPVTGTLVHAGWRVERCDLPKWIGVPAASQILAPAEVELAGK